MKKSKRKIKYIVIHCTASPEGKDFTAQDIDRWHKNRGWRGIGYNYVIRLDGTTEQGRDVDEIPSHVAGHNKESIGIVYVGGCETTPYKIVDGKKMYRSKDTRTDAQKKSLIKLLRELRKLYPTAQILGHRDFAGVKKACPCFDAKNEYKDI